MKNNNNMLRKKFKETIRDYGIDFDSLTFVQKFSPSNKEEKSIIIALTDFNNLAKICKGSRCKAELSNRDIGALVSLTNPPKKPNGQLYEVYIPQGKFGSIYFCAYKAKNSG